MSDKSKQIAKATENRLKCSFCGKQQEQVHKLIAGPGVYICDQCVGLCNKILDEKGFSAEGADKTINSPTISFDQRVSGPVTVWSSALSKIQVIAADQWRGQKIMDAESEESALVVVAALGLEELLKYYLINEVKAGAEPLFRALLHVKERLSGNASPELLPLLEQLALFYTNSAEYFLAASLLEWLLEISQVSQLIDERAKRQNVLNLVKLYIRLGRTSEADALLDALN